MQQQPRNQEIHDSLLCALHCADRGEWSSATEEIEIALDAMRAVAERERRIAVTALFNTAMRGISAQRAKSLRWGY